MKALLATLGAVLVAMTALAATASGAASSTWTETPG